MMINYSVTAMMVDLLQSHADRPLTEAEIETGGLAEVQSSRPPAWRHIPRSWLHLCHWRPFRGGAVGAAGGTS